MRCDHCKKVIIQEHKAIAYTLWGYHYCLCSFECANAILAKLPQLRDVCPSLASDIEMKAKTGTIETGSCCKILESHHELLKDDPEHLSTNFIKKLSQCSCRKV